MYAFRKRRPTVQVRQASLLQLRKLERNRVTISDKFPVSINKTNSCSAVGERKWVAIFSSTIGCIHRHSEPHVCSARYSTKSQKKRLKILIQLEQFTLSLIVSHLILNEVWWDEFWWEDWYTNHWGEIISCDDSDVHFNFIFLQDSFKGSCTCMWIYTPSIGYNTYPWIEWETSPMLNFKLMNSIYWFLCSWLQHSTACSLTHAYHQILTSMKYGFILPRTPVAHNIQTY